MVTGFLLKHGELCYVVLPSYPQKKDIQQQFFFMKSVFFFGSAVARSSWILDLLSPEFPGPFRAQRLLELNIKIIKLFRFYGTAGAEHLCWSSK